MVNLPFPVGVGTPQKADQYMTFQEPLMAAFDHTWKPFVCSSWI